MESDESSIAIVTESHGASQNGSLSAEEKSQHEAELKDELAKTEEEVNTLKQVLVSKQKRVQELKKQLGISLVSELQKDVKEKVKNISESDVVLRTNQALKSAGERTSAAFSTLGKKLEDVKNSDMYKSFEEKVTGAYENVKTGITKRHFLQRSKSLFALEGAKVGGSKSEPTTPAASEKPAE